MTESSSPQPLPDRPNLDQLRKQAKELQAAGKFSTLAAAQHATARRYGFTSWPKLKLAVESQQLRRLIKECDAKGVILLLRTSPRVASEAFSDGSTPLHDAAESNSPEIIAALVAAGVKFEQTYGGSSHTALSWAITVGSVRAALKLVELGSEPDLFCASGLGLLPTVQAFWDGNKLRPRPSRTGSSHYSDSGERLPCPPERDIDQVSDALYIAARSNQLEVARWLLDHGADPNWRGFMDATCLAWGEFSGNAELCALLRERGASDELLDKEFKAAPKVFGLMILVAWGFWRDRLRARLSADPSLVHSRGEWGTLLNAAAYNGQIESAKVLLEFGADKTARNAAGLTPSETAAARGYTELAKLLA
jgi:ankyrin repeat protein